MNREAIQQQYEELKRFNDPERYFDEYMMKVFPAELELLSHPDLEKTDLLFMLVGFSREPCVLVPCLHEPKQMVLLPSVDSEEDAYLLESATEDAFRQIGKQSPKIEVQSVDAFSAESTYKAIVGKYEALKAVYPREHIAIDLTFGKKTMLSGALIATLEIGVKNYYLDFTEYDKVGRRPVPGTNFYREFVPQDFLKRLRPEL